VRSGGGGGGRSRSSKRGSQAITLLLPSISSFSLLGDYVDRGLLGLECLAYLFAMKLSAPTKLFMLRGNHETRYVLTQTLILTLTLTLILILTPDQGCEWVGGPLW